MFSYHCGLGIQPYDREIFSKDDALMSVDERLRIFSNSAAIVSIGGCRINRKVAHPDNTYQID